MTQRKKIITGIGILLIGVFLWQFGLFNRFNYLTAKIDIMRNSPRIASIGKQIPCGVPCYQLKEKYGFHESNVGCSVTDPLLRGIDAYNTEIEKYLDKRNGKDWRYKFEKELDSLINHNLME